MDPWLGGNKEDHARNAMAPKNEMELLKKKLPYFLFVWVYKAGNYSI